MKTSTILSHAIKLLPCLETMVQARPHPVLRAEEFSVAWNANPVLAFSGFPTTILELKSEIERRFNTIRVDEQQYTLAEENMGGKWPKVTLGALRDDRELSLNDAVGLRNICDKFMLELRSCPPIVVERLHLVVFECRSLERRILAYPLAFRDRYKQQGPSKQDVCNEIPKDHAQYVAWVLGGFARPRLTTYWKNGLRKGEGKESDYRSDHVEVTLVVDLPHANSDIMQRFTEEVDRALPGVYCWFSPHSWHVTVRALRFEQKTASDSSSA